MLPRRQKGRHWDRLGSLAASTTICAILTTQDKPFCETLYSRSSFLHLSFGSRSLPCHSPSLITSGFRWLSRTRTFGEMDHAEMAIVVRTPSLFLRFSYHGKFILWTGALHSFRASDLYLIVVCKNPFFLHFSYTHLFGDSQMRWQNCHFSWNFTYISVYTKVWRIGLKSRKSSLFGFGLRIWNPFWGFGLFWQKIQSHIKSSIPPCKN